MTKPEEYDTEMQRTTIKRGLNRIEAVTYPDGRMEVTKQRLMHHSKRGYKARGPKRTLYEGHCMDAELVGAVLKEVFEADEQ